MLPTIHSNWNNLEFFQCWKDVTIIDDITIFLSKSHRHKTFDGQVFAAYLMCYAVTRSIVETFRGDYTPAHLHGGLTPAHLISIGIFAVGLVLFRLLARPDLKRG